jgi:hypothetical protein
MLELYTWPTSPPVAGWPHVMLSGIWDEIAIVQVVVAVAPFASVALTVKENVPAVVGVPVIAPDGLRDRPGSGLLLPFVRAYL